MSLSPGATWTRSSRKLGNDAKSDEGSTENLPALARPPESEEASRTSRHASLLQAGTASHPMSPCPRVPRPARSHSGALVFSAGVR